MEELKLGDDVIIKKTNELGRVVGVCIDGRIVVETQWLLNPDAVEKYSSN